MRQLKRLLHYVRPYWFQLLASVVSMALVGLFDAFRLLLIGPIFDHVLNPGTQPHELQLLPTTNWAMQLNWFVPERFHNVWTMVAFAWVAETWVLTPPTSVETSAILALAVLAEVFTSLISLLTCCWTLEIGRAHV